ncbi:dUTP diphosphatase [Lepidopterella palustris CBS 459.81]|uniref:Deoxyuridine 5'-triphosphate nucleotidohydrolase n=1 Tax=Lepidopterella palustris CBS 459.81 TaxID=1314670 RepID=A0A8E2E1S1_9PEZI|nr:dUTP diphosphatase [Lepidopterella palustris CBS 459.81]
MSTINDDIFASTPAPTTHEPPSLPASPLPKRTKIIDPIPLSQSSTLPRGTDSGVATPTPLAMEAAQHHPTHALGSAAAITSSQASTLQVQFLSSKAKAPTRGSAFAAGHDLYSARDIVIPARGRARVDTDIAVSVPVGTYGRIAPRSGLAAKHGIDTLAGVIDADYRGQVGVILANLSDADFAIKEGDRIAQLIVEKIVMPEVVVVEKLEESVRGAGGFGSTGGFGMNGI